MSTSNPEQKFINSPFGHDGASKILLDFTKNELFPIKNNLMDFLIEVSTFKPNIVKSFYRKKLNRIENKYIDLTKLFSDLLRKYETPDIIFKSLDVPNQDKEKIGYVMKTYMNFATSIKPILGDCLRLLEIIDRAISNKRNVADFKMSIILSIIAITIALITSII